MNNPTPGEIKEYQRGLDIGCSLYEKELKRIKRQAQKKIKEAFYVGFTRQVNGMTITHDESWVGIDYAWNQYKKKRTP